MGRQRRNGEESASRKWGSGGGVDREHQQGDRAVEKSRMARDDVSILQYCIGIGTCWDERARLCTASEACEDAITADSASIADLPSHEYTISQFPLSSQLS